MKPQDWIEEWLELWPADKEFNGYKFKSKAKDCVNKMVKFCKDNPAYTKEVIFAATQMYLKQQEQKNWEYTKQATYFISKLGEPSVLEAFCIKIINGQKPIETTIIDFYTQNDFI